MSVLRPLSSVRAGGRAAALDGARSVLRALGRAVLLLLACVVPATGLAGPDAEGCDTVAMLTEVRRAIGDAADVPVTLFDRLPTATLGDGLRVRYTIPLPACDQARAVLVTRAAAAYRVRVDGEPAARLAPPPTWWMPRPERVLVNPRVPAAFLLPAGAREVSLDLEGMAFMDFGLGPLPVGPVAAIAERQARSHHRVIGSVTTAGAVVGVVIAVGAIAWLRRRDDKGLFWFTMAAAAWALRGLYGVSTELPVRPLYFETGVTVTVAALGLVLGMATLHILGVWSRRWLRGVAVTALVQTAMVVAGLLWPQVSYVMRSVVYAILLGWVLLLAGVVVRHTGHLAGWRRPVLVIGYLVVAAAFVHDWALVQGMLPMTNDRISMIAWGYLGLLGAFVVLITDHLLQALARVQQLNVELEARVRDRTRALERSLAEREAERIAWARSQARQEERERMMREIHDGIGSQLTTALRGVERGSLEGEQVAQALRDSIDELRLIIDTASPASSFALALATWRHRWGPRIEALGMALAWRIDDSVDEVDLPDGGVLQLMRCLQEAVANAVRHAQARRVAITARATADALTLEVADDGIGLSAQARTQPAGQGLRSMRHRLEHLGGALQFDDAAGGLTLRFVVPRRQAV